MASEHQFNIKVLELQYNNNFKTQQQYSLAYCLLQYIKLLFTVNGITKRQMEAKIGHFATQKNLSEITVKGYKGLLRVS